MRAAVCALAALLACAPPPPIASLHVELGPVVVPDPDPIETTPSALVLDDDRWLVTGGPIGAWYEHLTACFELVRTDDGWRAGRIDVWRMHDVAGSEGWLDDLSGRVIVDVSDAESERIVRIGYRLAGTSTGSWLIDPPREPVSLAVADSFEVRLVPSFSPYDAVVRFARERAP